MPTAAQIAERAGYSVRSIFERFPDLTALRVAVTDYSIAEARANTASRRTRGRRSRRWSGAACGSTCRMRSATSSSRSRPAPSCGDARPLRRAAADGGRVGLAPFVAALALAVTPVSFVQAHAQNGAFAEPNGTADALLTSWAVLGLRAVDRPAPGLARLPAVAGALAPVADRRRARRARGAGTRRRHDSAARHGCPLRRAARSARR